MELKQFKITVVPLRDKLLNYARRMTDDPSDAEDAVQEVMLKLWNLRQKLDEYRSIEAVAMTMTHHLCMDLWRAKRPDTLSLDRVQAPTPSATPERLLEEKDDAGDYRLLAYAATNNHPHERHRRVRNGRNCRNHRMQCRSHSQQSVKSPQESKRSLFANNTRTKKEEQSMKDIETLLNKYFEGETTCEEERRLRRFFAEGLVPEHLEVYRPMFAFFEAEQEELTEVSGQCNAGEMPELAIFEKKTKTVRKYLTYSLGAAAAALLLLLGISGIYRHISPAPANYVIIDGKEYTDVHLIREQAMVAFRDVSLSEEEIFATLFDE